MEPRFPIDASWTQETAWTSWGFYLLMSIPLLVPLVGIVRAYCDRKFVISGRWVLACYAGAAVQFIIAAYVDGQASAAWDIPHPYQGTVLYFPGMWMLTLGLIAVGYATASDQRSLSRMKEWAFCTLFVTPFVGALFLPQVQRTRSQARRSQCKNNLKQLAIAAHNFREVHNVWPRSQQGAVPVSWRVAILPYFDEASLREQYKDNETWDSSANTAIARRRLWLYACPSHRNDQDSEHRHLTSYVMPSGPGMISSPNADVRDRDITDGISNTLLFAEAAGLRIVWTEPRDADVAQTSITINQAGDHRQRSPSLLSSYHVRGANIVLADGSVRFINNDIDPAILRAMTTISGGENISVQE